MTSPLKPWEKSGVNNMQSSTSSSIIDHMSSQPFNAQRSVPASSAPRNPPPVPTRNYMSQRSDLLTNYNGFGYGGFGGSGYGTGYGSYGTGYSPSPYGGMYGGMNGGFGMNRLNNDSFSPGSFAHHAEVSSRQAFQSVESVVHAVGSVAALLESTFQALYNSFRAVIGVADHMSRVKVHITRIFSTVALMRTLRWLISWLLSVLRFRQLSSSDDQLWSQAAEHVASNVISLPESRSNWPVAVFFAIIIGGPWLLWKFLSSLTADTAQTSAWATAEDDHYVAVAEFDFTGQTDDELSFGQGAVITIAPKALQPHVRGWLMASVDGQKIGLIPANYVRILGKRHGSRPSKTCLQSDAGPDSHWDQDFVVHSSNNSDR